MSDRFFSALLVMAGTTYLLRVLPLLFFRKKISGRFLRSFLYYLPYAVLTVMTVPGFFTTSLPLPAAIVGFAVAFLFAFFGKNLLTVASGAAISVFLCELLLSLSGM